MNNNNIMFGGIKLPKSPFNRVSDLTQTLGQKTSNVMSSTLSNGSAMFSSTIQFIKDKILSMPYVIIAIAIIILLIIIFMIINGFIKSNILQWFIWIFLFIYLALFVAVQFYFDENFNPWASAMVAALFIYLFPSPLFNTRKNKSSTLWISIGFSSLLLLTTFLMINGYTSDLFSPALGGLFEPKVIFFNYILPSVVLIFPPLFYWSVFY